MGAQGRQILSMNAFDASVAADSGAPLLSRRGRNVGAASVLFYRRPIEMVRGRGCWLEAADGVRYLDFYNNVPSVGHCHPRVVGAIARQVAELNINTRYLHAGVETYLERLKATLPEALTNVVLCCTGSEANDLALRLARAVTGCEGVVVTETAYHGNTAAVTAISPSAWKQGMAPAHLRIVPPPSASAFGDDVEAGFATAVAAAAADLQRSGHGLAAFICDSIFSSDGVHADPPGLLRGAVAAAHAAAGLYIADEVQPGFARTGDAMWGFARHGVLPDVVTMGKPMGNGFPMAAMVTRPDLLERFCEDVGYFNTFGGNPVAAAAGLAVLDVIEEEQLQDNAREVGAYLRARLKALGTGDSRIAEIRGAGLFIGVELRCGGTPASDLASDLINGLCERRVLIGAAGRYGNTLKIRPPLSLTADEAGFFVDALADALSTVPVTE